MPDGDAALEGLTAFLARFAGLTENCYTTNQSQESTCLTLLRNECCVGDSPRSAVWVREGRRERLSWYDETGRGKSERTSKMKLKGLFLTLSAVMAVNMAAAAEPITDVAEVKDYLAPY